MSKSLNTNFVIQAPKPIDDRLQVDTFASLNGIAVKYQHMVVHVLDVDKDYKYYQEVPEWVEVTIPTQTGAAIWGNITGTLTDQTDLITYLQNNFADINHTHPQLPPLAHTHVEVDITDLDKYTQAEVDALVAYKSGLTTGIIEGGDVSINVDTTKFDVAAGTLMYQEFTAQDPFVEPIIHNVVFTAWTAVTPTYLATHPASYIGITYNPGTTTFSLVQSATPFNQATRRVVAPIAIVYHGNNTTIDRVVAGKGTPINNTNQFEDLMESLGVMNLSGNVISANGANLSIDRSGGSIFARGSNFDISTSNPHVRSQNAAFALSFTYTTQTSVETGATTLDPDTYDVAGTATVVPTDNWTIQRFYVYPDGYVRAQYGQNLYATKVDAVSELLSETFVEEQNVITDAVLRAYLVIQEGATDASNLAEAEFFEVSQYGWVASRLENIESDKYYEHDQSVSATTWNIAHNLNKNPAVTIIDTSGNNVEGEIAYTDLNNLTVTFNTGFTGKAYCN